MLHLFAETADKALEIDKKDDPLALLSTDKSSSPSPSPSRSLFKENVLSPLLKVVVPVFTEYEELFRLVSMLNDLKFAVGSLKVPKVPMEVDFLCCPLLVRGVSKGVEEAEPEVEVQVETVDDELILLFPPLIEWVERDCDSDSPSPSAVIFNPPGPPGPPNGALVELDPLWLRLLTELFRVPFTNIEELLVPQGEHMLLRRKFSLDFISVRATKICWLHHGCLQRYSANDGPLFLLFCVRTEISSIRHLQCAVCRHGSTRSEAPPSVPHQHAKEV